MKKLLKLISSHKVLSLIIIIALVSFGYLGYKKVKANSGETRYVLAAVEKGTLITSVSGSGQVSVSDQVDIKPKASGDITAVYVTAGTEVKSGTLLARIDTVDAERAVRDAETSLETSKLELEQLLEPEDELTLFQSENSLIQAKEAKQKADDNLNKSYEDGFNTVANIYLSLPTAMAGLQDILMGYSFSNNQWNMDYYADAVRKYDEKVSLYRDDAYSKYQTARKAYDENFKNYKATSRDSSKEVIKALIEETYITVKAVSDVIKSANNLILFYQDKLAERDLKPSSLSNTHISSLNNYMSTTNSNLSNVLSAKRSIEDYKDAITSAERSIKEKELSLAKIKSGPDDLTLRAKRIVIQQKEEALSTAKQDLSDHYLRAPFSGVIVQVSAKKGDSASAGTSLMTLVTKQKYAEISLNEVDIAKVKVGQKVNLTFDAIDDLTVTGAISEVDALGAVTQGVVTYDVKIGFDTQEDKVKSGMSVSASIITDVKQNVLLVPNAAVKSQGNNNYVEILNSTTSSSQLLAGIAATGISSKTSPKQQTIETGLSNDTYTEIVSGLNEGDQVVTQTITNKTAASSNQSQQNSSFRIPGVTGGFSR